MSHIQLAQEQRYQIYALKKAGVMNTELANILQVHKSAVCSELKRNTGGRGDIRGTAADTLDKAMSMAKEYTGGDPITSYRYRHAENEWPRPGKTTENPLSQV